MATSKHPPRFLGVSKILLVGIPMLAITLFLFSWVNREKISNLASSENRITACDINKVGTRFFGDSIYIEVLLEGPEPNHFGFSEPDEFFDDMNRLCNQRARIRIQYIQGESKFYSQIGNWIVSLKSVDDNETIFTLQKYEKRRAEKGVPWINFGILGGILWLISLLYLLRHRHLEVPSRPPQ